MKQYFCNLITGNFYRYSVYKITDYYKNIIYVAEPVGIGVTRSANDIEKLKEILEKDVYLLNHVWTH